MRRLEIAVQAQRREGESQQHGAWRQRPRRAGRRRTRSRIAPQNRPSPSARLSLQRSGTRTLSTRSPSQESIAGNTVSEPIIATATTVIVAIANGMNDLSPEKNIPGHGNHHRDAGDEDCTTRGRRGGLEGGRLAPAPAPFVTLAADVEERVVDTHREPDEQDDRRDVLVHGTMWLGSASRPIVANTDVSPSRSADRRPDERAEHEQKDSERERDRQETRPPELRREQLIEGLPGRGSACLTDVEAGVGFMDLVDSRRDRVDVPDRLVVRALRAELDQHRVAVLRDLTLVPGRERRAKLRHLREAVESRDGLDDDSAERRVVDRRLDFD